MAPSRMRINSTLFPGEIPVLNMGITGLLYCPDCSRPSLKIQPSTPLLRRIFIHSPLIAITRTSSPFTTLATISEVRSGVCRSFPLVQLTLALLPFVNFECDFFRGLVVLPTVLSLPSAVHAMVSYCPPRIGTVCTNLHQRGDRPSRARSFPRPTELANWPRDRARNADAACGYVMRRSTSWEGSGEYPREDSNL